MKALTKKQRYELLRSQLNEEMIQFKGYWQELSSNILPRRSRFFVDDVNRGDRRNLEIIDSTATLASRTLSSGMMAGVTSPARQWFKLTTDTLKLNDIPEVKSYLSIVEEKMRSVFLKSNLYQVLPVLYGDLGTFATGCIFMEEDMDSVINFTCFPIGSYMIANDKKGRVRVFVRDFQMSVRQIIEKFGMLPNGEVDWTKISEAVRSQYEKQQYETMVNVTHIVCPNEDYKPNRVESKFKKFKSVYYEQGVSSKALASGMTTNDDVFLSEKGYDFFPVLCVRWEVAGEDTYGTNSPGMVSLGDVKQLQFGEKRSAQAVDQKVRPSMVGPVSLQNANASILPGDITYLDEREGTKGFRRLFEVDFDIRELENKQAQLRDRISKAYYEDLFLMLANSDRSQITAREIDERHEEKLLALGPVLERINQDLLDPMIENTYLIMERQGLLPDAPDALAGEDYVIEYVSVMAQAQKLAGIGQIERFLGFVGQVASFDPTVIQKVNLEESIEQYANLIGISPELLKTKLEMAKIKEQQAQAAQREQQMAEAGAMVQAGKALSETKMDENTALNRVLGNGGQIV